MSYQFLPNIIFIFAILGLLLLVLRRLPEALAEQDQKDTAIERMSSKGLPAIAVSKLKSTARLWLQKAWQFILEAKGLKPSSVVGYRIKKIWTTKRQNLYQFQKNMLGQPQASEDDYLNTIKKEPKNLSHYDALAKFYLEQHKLTDALDIYEYLIGHDPANAEYHSRLAGCCYQLEQWDKAVAHYKKSLLLDSTQPNRYYNLGLALEAQNNFSESADAFAQAVQLEPSSLKYQMALGEAYIKNGKLDEAKKLFYELNRKDPGNQKVQTKLKELRFKKS